MGYNFTPNAAIKPTGNDFAAFMKVADFDTVYRRVKKFDSPDWTVKPVIEKNTPLSNQALELLKAIYTTPVVEAFLNQNTQQPTKPVETGENSEAKLKAKYQAQIDQLEREKSENEAAHNAAVETLKTQIEQQKQADTQRISDLQTRLTEKTNGQTEIKTALCAVSAATCA